MKATGDSYILNETTDIFESLGSYDSLKFVSYLLDTIYNSIRNECETDKDIKTIKKLEKSLNLIDEIIKENKENEL